MTNRTCPIGLNQCYKCAYRQEVNDCGYDGQDSYDEAVQEATKRSLIEIEKPDSPKPTLILSGISTAQGFQQAMWNEYLGEYYYQGFALAMDEPILILRHEGELVFVFGEDMRPTIQAIHTACRLHLLRERAG